MSVNLQFIGSGDAFGSGGRLQTCMLLRGAGDDVVIDLGASSLVGLKRAGIDTASLKWIAISHLHGDHFGGLPFLVLDGQFSRREETLTAAGPNGIEPRVSALMEALFPGSSVIQRRFPVDFRELRQAEWVELGPARVMSLEVDHASGAPSLALRVEYGGKVVAYSGDTTWTERLCEIARDADLFVCEGYTFDRPIRYHMDVASLQRKTDDIGCQRIIITHMGPEMLARQDEARFECASDGLVVEV